MLARQILPCCTCCKNHNRSQQRRSCLDALQAHTCSFCLRASMATCFTALKCWRAALSCIFFSQELVRMGFFVELALWLGSFQLRPEPCKGAHANVEYDPAIAG